MWDAISLRTISTSEPQQSFGPRHVLGVCLLLCSFTGGIARAQTDMGDIYPGFSIAKEQRYRVVDLVVTGLRRTSFAWLQHFVGQRFPAHLTQREARFIARRLLTTGVFTEAKVVFEARDAGIDADYTMHIDVEEKWTTIPVARGALGGGTPLRVLGVYDTHVLGRLLTLGAEARKYGDAPPGFVVYARDPRGDGGRYFLGLEFWRDFRRRTVYSRNGEELGHAGTNAALTRAKVLWPVDEASGVLRSSWNWKWGAEFEHSEAFLNSFEASEHAAASAGPEVRFDDGPRRLDRILPTLLYDDIELAHLELEGTRLKLRGGPILGAGKVHSSADLESYGYWLAPKGLNLAVHGFAGAMSVTSPQSMYYLGGLDSVRGLPDGALFGTHAAFGNGEARFLLWRAHYLWLQGIAFADVGAAGPSFSAAFSDTRTSGGVGLRFAVPQVYRLVFRIDYAWALDGSGAKGVAAGMNQFFDPYNPL